MNKQNQLLCVCSGILFMLLFFLGFWPLAGFVPPPAPDLPADAVAALYRNGTGPIRLGTALIILCAGFLAPWTAVISEQMKRMGGRSSLLSSAQLLSGGAAIVLFTVSGVLWAATAFRPERSPELTQALHDLAWLSIITPVGPFIVQNLVLGLAIVQDRRTEPVFPRWAGFFNFWVAVLLGVGVMGIFFKQGPFAWNGLFVFWVPLVTFGAWYVVMIALLVKAIGKEAEDS